MALSSSLSCRAHFFCLSYSLAPSLEVLTVERHEDAFSRWTDFRGISQALQKETGAAPDLPACMRYKIPPPTHFFLIVPPLILNVPKCGKACLIPFLYRRFFSSPPRVNVLNTSEEWSEKGTCLDLPARLIDWLSTLNCAVQFFFLLSSNWKPLKRASHVCLTRLLIPFFLMQRSIVFSHK